MRLPFKLLNALESGKEASIAQVDLSVAFDRVKREGILCQFCSLNIGDTAYWRFYVFEILGIGDFVH